VELFETIRREHEHGVGTTQGIARKLGVHRRMVRQALQSAVPRQRKIPQRERPKLGPAVAFIDAILQADQKAPRKQRHTAHRIWVRLRREKPEVVVGEATVRTYVRKRKRELGLLHQETFIPQSYAYGVEAQVDWYEACAEIEGERRKVYGFCIGSAFARGLTKGATPAKLRFKADFYKMVLKCGNTEIQPIHPGKIAHVISVRSAFINATDATYEGFYMYPFNAISSSCGTVTLELYSEKNPSSGKTKTLDMKTVNRVSEDFRPYASMHVPAAGSDGR
jgi:hypothetical protein